MVLDMEFYIQLYFNKCIKMRITHQLNVGAADKMVCILICIELWKINNLFICNVFVSLYLLLAYLDSYCTIDIHIDSVSTYCKWLLHNLSLFFMQTEQFLFHYSTIWILFFSALRFVSYYSTLRNFSPEWLSLFTPLQI